MEVTALREALCFTAIGTGLGGEEFTRCLITTDPMICGSRFPPKRKR
jgi:hypothetical protein